MLTPDSAFQLATPAGPYRGVAVNLPTTTAPWATGPARCCRLDDRAFGLCTLIDGIVDSPGTGAAQLLEHLGLALCHAVRGVIPRPAPVDPVVVQAQLRIRSHLGSPEPLARILADIGPSYRQVARRFIAVTGQNPKTWQLALRLREARRLLEETDLTVTAIAIELGFPSSQHFATVFRQRTGRNPSAHRAGQGSRPG